FDIRKSSCQTVEYGGKTAMSSPQSRMRARALETLSSSGPQSRAELARKIGVSRSTMSALVTVLLSDGLVEEIGNSEEASKMAGRPGTRIALANPKGYYIGIDFGRIFIKAAIADANYRIIEQISADFDIEMPAEDALDLAAAKVDH